MTHSTNSTQYYPVKALFEQILGKRSYLRVKEYAPIKAWKDEATRFLRAIELAIAETVKVADDEWHDEVTELVAHGKDRVAAASSVEDILAALSATLGELCFLQVGYVPRGHWKADRIRLVKKNWQLDPVRSVQYVQTKAQQETQRKLRSRQNARNEA